MPRPVVAVLALSACCLWCLMAPAAAPPARVPAEWLKLIDQLGSEDEATVKAAETKLTALGAAAVPVLREALRTHDDADVRLRAAVIAGAIEQELRDEVRQFTGHG